MRIGVDLGGTKIEGILMGPNSEVLRSMRVPTPQGNYEGTVKSIVSLIADLSERQSIPVGICTPGSINPPTGLMQNCNSTCLNGKNLKEDLNKAVGREIRIANDADCLALSEAHGGAASGCQSVFGVILGTGVGGGLVIHGNLVNGPNALSGEWGHNPLRPTGGEQRPCYCGRSNCIETWISGPAIEAEYHGLTGQTQKATELATSDDPIALATIDRFILRLGEALGPVINIVDPEYIVFGGGLSKIARIYTELPDLLPNYIMSETCRTKIVKAEHGDSSGVRGAAWLWP